jgi:hypothetical protein
LKEVVTDPKGDILLLVATPGSERGLILNHRTPLEIIRPYIVLSILPAALPLSLLAKLIGRR